MNTLILQVWEESTPLGISQNGCSLHLSILDRDKFIKSKYMGRDSKNIPKSYDRIVGNTSDVLVSDDLYKLVSERKSIRLMRYELNNLIGMEDIINVS